MTLKNNQLILVGNGFDLAHNLKTRYTDFLLWFLNKGLSSQCETQLNFSYKGLLDFKLKNRFFYSEITDIQSFLNNPLFILSPTSDFMHRLINNDGRWVDIEYCYYNELVNIYRSIESNFRLINNALELVKKLNSDFDIIKQSLIEYLTTINIDESIINFRIIELLQENYLTTKPNSRWTTSIVNFNYTRTLDLYIKEIKPNNTRVINIHGRLDQQNYPIIFGYGDEMDFYYEKIERLNDNVFLKNMKSFSYFKAPYYRQLLGYINSGDPFDVTIFGHSCGISDRILLNSIFEHENLGSIKIYYYTEADYLEKTMEISRHFRPLNKGKMRAKIVTFEDSRPLPQL